MKKTLAIVAAAAFAAASSTPAFACMYGKTVSNEKPAPITTALNSQPATPAPGIQPIEPETEPAKAKPEAKSDS